jgi:hypothetical protein
MNYAKWSMKMEAILIQHGLWSIMTILVSGIAADVMEKDMLMITAELDLLFS